ESSKSKLICCENSALSVQVALFGFLVLPDADLVESVKCSAVFKSLKPIKLRCFSVVGRSARSA
ncbi:hypothetical protein, partial [Vibrio cholerae]|uniref:hypothetical protein n=1 Tax=Vibrio cholerae TaxID=666 RepID=UPI0009B50075